MKWITRERSKIDRIACPWLIKQFIDAEAEFTCVPKEEVFPQAEQLRVNLDRIFWDLNFPIRGVQLPEYFTEIILVKGGSFDYNKYNNLNEIYR